MPRIGDYELEHLIGAGTAGTVWRAQQQGPTARVVALKRLRPDAGTSADLGSIRREAELLAGLDHPHIVRVFDVLEYSDGNGDAIAMAMQYAANGSFKDVLAQRRRLPAAEVVAVAAPIADALASAHRVGVLHGDVKPANILFTRDGVPLLADFGVARTLGTAIAGQVAGSAAYLAPELLAPGSAADPQADVYSLAVVCYEALAGLRPFRGPDPDAVLQAASAGEHERLTGRAGIPEPLAEVVEQAMARDPSRRFTSADGFASALRAAVDHQPVRVPEIHPLPAVVALDDATVATDTFGPRPPRPTPRRPSVLRRLLSRGRAVLRVRRPVVGRPVPAAALRRVSFAAGLGLAGLLVGLGIMLKVQDTGPGCPAAVRPDLGAGAELLVGDPEGDGCDSYGVFGPQVLDDDQQRMVATMALDGTQRSVVLGAPGDRLFLGDWYCTGRDTLGLYRTAQGEVAYFATWPESDDEPPQPTHVLDAPADGHATVVRQDNGTGEGSDAGCDWIRVDPP